jgi:hypothetical protein
VERRSRRRRAGQVYFSSQLTWGKGDESVLLVPEGGGAAADVGARFRTTMTTTATAR